MHENLIHDELSISVPLGFLISIGMSNVLLNADGKNLFLTGKLHEYFVECVDYNNWHILFRDPASTVDKVVIRDIGSCGVRDF